MKDKALSKPHKIALQLRINQCTRSLNSHSRERKKSRAYSCTCVHGLGRTDKENNTEDLILFCLGFILVFFENEQSGRILSCFYHI